MWQINQKLPWHVTTFNPGDEMCEYSPIVFCSVNYCNLSHVSKPLSNWSVGSHWTSHSMRRDQIDQNSNSLTHWGRDKMAAISQTTLSNAFSWMKISEFRLKFHWRLFLMVQLTIFQHWFRWWLGADQATSHYLNQWWLDHWRIYASLGLNELMWDWWHVCVSELGHQWFFPSRH